MTSLHRGCCCPPPLSCVTIENNCGIVRPSSSIPQTFSGYFLQRDPNATKVSVSGRMRVIYQHQAPSPAGEDPYDIDVNFFQYDNQLLDFAACTLGTTTYQGQSAQMITYTWASGGFSTSPVPWADPAYVRFGENGFCEPESSNGSCGSYNWLRVSRCSLGSERLAFLTATFSFIVGTDRRRWSVGCTWPMNFPNPSFLDCPVLSDQQSLANSSQSCNGVRYCANTLNFVHPYFCGQPGVYNCDPVLYCYTPEEIPECEGVPCTDPECFDFGCCYYYLPCDPTCNGRDVCHKGVVSMPSGPGVVSALSVGASCGTPTGLDAGSVWWNEVQKQ